MSDRPVFIYAATYTARADAFADYDSVLELHAAKLPRHLRRRADRQGRRRRGARLKAREAEQRHPARGFAG